MTSFTARVVALLAALATVLFVAACTSPASDGHSDHQHGAESSGDGQAAAFNDADVTFATNMIPHHQQAVDLAAMVPQRSSDPALVELAAAISKAQEPEIATMKAFLVQWTGGESGDGGHEGHDMGSMNGMVDAATMAKLDTLKGKDFDTLWLQSMIAHHAGAIEMANAEIADGANADAKTLAQEIVDTQQGEISQMNSMLAS